MNFRKIISLDIETRSDKDLKTVGVYNYVNAHAFCLLWLTVIENYTGRERVIDLWHNELPEDVIYDILDPTVLKVAANATFERICFSRVLGVHLPADSWTCTLVLAGRNGYPMSLAGAAAQTRADVQKDKAGDALIKLFSIPQKPTKANLGRMWVNPADEPERWSAYGNYNRIDVHSEIAVRMAVRDFPVSEFEERLYILDQKINDRGVLIDTQFVDQAIQLNQSFAATLKQQIIDATGVRNPNSRNQLIAWLNVETDETHSKLDKEAVKAILGDAPTEIVQQVMEARQALNRASVAKYAAMRRFAGADGRARGTLQFYGANRTGRWAGRGIQLHNLTKHKVKADILDRWRELIKLGDLYGLAAANGGNVNDALSQAVRTSFIAKPGHHFLVSDYSAIEARVLAWLAGEQWRLEVFAGSKDIYLASVARVMGVDPDSLSKKDPLRQLGKVLELAYGYQGSVGALKMALATYKFDLPESKYPEMTRAWRNENPAIVRLWDDMNNTAMQAIVNPDIYYPVQQGKCGFIFKNGNLLMRLPSGRHLSYVRARIVLNKFGKPGIAYEGTGDQGAWVRLDTYGGKLVENACQAIARDILAHGLMNIDAAGFAIVLHVHDEAVVEEPINGRSLEEVNHLMCIKEPWYADMPLKAEGFVSPYYKKDDN